MLAAPVPLVCGSDALSFLPHHRDRALQAAARPLCPTTRRSSCVILRVLGRAEVSIRWNVHHFAQGPVPQRERCWLCLWSSRVVLCVAVWLRRQRRGLAGAECDELRCGSCARMVRSVYVCDSCRPAFEQRQDLKAKRAADGQPVVSHSHPRLPPRALRSRPAALLPPRAAAPRWLCPAAALRPARPVWQAAQVHARDGCAV